MKTVSQLYKSEEAFVNFIIEHELPDYQNVLVNIFSGKISQNEILMMGKLITTHIPGAVIIGSTTDGEIASGAHTTEGILISFTVFEKTEIKSFSVKNINKFNASFLGEEIGSSYTSSDSKAIILYSSLNASETGQFLEGIKKTAPQVKIAGGRACDNGDYVQSFVFDGNEVIADGITGVVLDSNKLTAYVGHHSSWKEVGRSFLITKAIGANVYALEHKKPLQILRQYLGERFVERLPLSGSEFPFLLKNQDDKYPIFIHKKGDNGSIQLSQDVSEGDELTFAYADTEEIIEQTGKDLRKLTKKSIETIFLFPCMSRRRFLPDYTSYELEVFETIAPSVGFFCNGEIVDTDEKIRIDGNVLTYIALSETKQDKKEGAPLPKFKRSNQMNTMSTFTHLMEASTRDLQQMHDNIRVSEQYYRSLFDHNSDIVYSTDLQGRFTSVNRALEKVFGYEQSELVGKNAIKFIQAKETAKVRMHFYRTMRGKEQFYTLEVVSKTGQYYTLNMKNIPIIVNGEMVGIYGIGRDITEQIRTNEKVTHLAHYDLETGLANRTLFTEKVEMQIKAAVKKKRSLAVMFIDMDSFSLINDSLGHNAGDYILKELAYRIQNSLPKGSFLGRFGGDKFTVLATKSGKNQDFYEIAYNIFDKIKQPVLYDQQEYFVTSSVGVSIFPTDGTDTLTLFRNADTAMNRAKLMGGNRIVLFSNELNENVKKRLEMERDLRKALERNEFHLVFQPIVDIETKKFTGSEALLRWNHPQYGEVPPAVFIPIAEEIGIIKEIGKWVLHEACRQNARWHRLGFRDLTISVNVSAHQLLDPIFVIDVANTIDETGLPPEYLYLELTESVMIGNLQYCLRVMKDLQQLGVNLSIDDFGTGYSSLSYLKTLPVNRLKIDKTFIDQLSRNTPDLAVVQAVIMMGKGLNMKVVAEGVETKEQVTVLEELSCHFVQGFYFSKPLKEDAFEKELLVGLTSKI
ncbi:diguanylate cyclase/phosphodiesterase with PAS/PAC sensor(s) [Bacillus oleivorans]|uniref:Diguanylate cyclase/phosphodiesterase with PAS/PAC sensor(S) n=1 Tax=Bacillus oleivorans TaxID=1448271 RepID=A0A285CRA8_9BACI|nr:EAL domain-containing protein [Bacillus oleivorans]SNX70072.1 diguanylate cyclase/phosphodiesterase with PAS/PAC sensor(s) [Bacillus oleivorans]